MFYPKSISVMGQTIAVEILDKPLYQFHTCPKCVLPQSYSPFSFPATNTNKTCPSCGEENTQPVPNSYVVGQYLIKENVIKNWHSDKCKEGCETSFIHEVIEAINSIGDLKLNHTQITTLAASLYQALSSGNVAFGTQRVANNHSFYYEAA